MWLMSPLMRRILVSSLVEVCLYNLPCSPLVTVREEDAHLLGSLVKNFQQQSFKGWQLKVIHATLEGKDTLVVQPTGAGKSLCFQFPTTVTKNITIVITPMISLMIDQVENLQLKRLRATYLGSAQRDSSMETRVLERRFHIIYCTPESFVNATGSMKPPFRSLLAQRMMGLIAIDEAHLVRTWRSFRPAYQHLYNVIRSIPAVTVMALTATATPQTRDMLKLMLREPVCEIGSVNKPNITYTVTLLKLASGEDK